MYVVISSITIEVWVLFTVPRGRSRRYSTPTLQDLSVSFFRHPIYTFRILLTRGRCSFSHCQCPSLCLSLLLDVFGVPRPPVALLQLLVAPSPCILLFYDAPGRLGLSKLHHLLSGSRKSRTPSRRILSSSPYFLLPPSFRFPSRLDFLTPRIVCFSSPAAEIPLPVSACLPPRVLPFVHYPTCTSPGFLPSPLNFLRGTRRAPRPRLRRNTTGIHRTVETTGFFSLTRPYRQPSFDRPNDETSGNWI